MTRFVEGTPRFNKQPDAASTPMTRRLEEAAKKIAERVKGFGTRDPHVASIHTQQQGLRDIQIGGSGKLEEGLKEGVIGLEQDIYPNQSKEIKQDWNLRPIEPSDIPKIAEWFRDPSVREHIADERLDTFVPNIWNPNTIREFQSALHDFYFPGGKIKLPLRIPPHKTEDGRLESADDSEDPKLIEVIQRTHVCTINGKLVGVQSWLSDDPYAPQAVRKEIDEGREKAAYGLVLITNPEYRRLHVATILSLARNDIVLGKDEDHPGAFTQISGLVTHTDGWGAIFNLFREIGYEVDRDPDGHAVPQMVNGREMAMWRVVLGRKKWWRIRDEVYGALDKKMNPKEDAGNKSV